MHRKVKQEGGGLPCLHCTYIATRADNLWTQFTKPILMSFTLKLQYRSLRPSTWARASPAVTAPTWPTVCPRSDTTWRQSANTPVFLAGIVNILPTGRTISSCIVTVRIQQVSPRKRRKSALKLRKSLAG